MCQLLSSFTLPDTDTVNLRTALIQLCQREDAKKKTNGFSPVSSDVIEIVCWDKHHWNLNTQLIRFTKPLVDMIGDLESRDASLADAMIQLLKCARTLETLRDDEYDDHGFSQHARAEFAKGFHYMNTDLVFFGFFLHPLCRNLALARTSHTPHARSMADVITIALGIAKKWGWNEVAASSLITDLQHYQQAKEPFSGGLANGSQWWEQMPVTTREHPLKGMALRIFSIVPHAGEVERLFSNLKSMQGDDRAGLSVATIRSAGRMRCHYRDLIQARKIADGERVRKKHAHMHTREGGIIDVDAVKDLEDAAKDVAKEGEGDGDGAAEAQLHAEQEIERSFEMLRKRDEEDWREGRSDAEIAYLETVQKANARPSQCYNLQGDALDRVLDGAAPISQAEDERVHQDESGGGTGWNVRGLMSSKGF